MPPLVSNGAMITCSFAMPPVPVPLAVIPMGTPVTCDTPAANIQAFAPMVNIPTFGMCGTMSNPTVAAATA
ncbi:MAG TPA: PAAR-like protein, partial [Solirubrobacteraceae bacterium]